MAERDEAIAKAGGILNPVSAGIGIATTIAEMIGKGAARRRQRKLLSQVKAYQTPQEIYDALNATEQRASMGLSERTLDYLSGRSDARLSSAIDVVNQLGGDPNILANIFGQSQKGMESIAEMDTEAQLRNFQPYFAAVNNLAANKAAEQKSQQDIIKDKLQAEGLNLSYSNMAISNGMNLVMQALGNWDASKLWKDKQTKTSEQ